MDLKTEMKNFSTIDLEKIVQSGSDLPDNIRNSYFLYNRAIESLNSGSEDIAAIELKKAVAMNPKFYEAMNLLGVCYSYMGETEKAAGMFGRVIEAGADSILAMDYIQRLGLGEALQIRKNRQADQPVQKPGEPLKRVRTAKKTRPAINIKSKPFLNAAKIAAGFAAGLLLATVVYFSLPEKKIEPDEQKQTGEETSLDEIKAEYEARYSELEQKYGLLQKDKDDIVQQADYYKATIKLYEIDIMFRDKKYEDAADMLLLMKTVEFRDSEKEKFDKLYESVMPLAGKAAYDQGYKLYNSRKYQDSLKKLEKVQTYFPEFEKMDAVMYYMGRNCQALNDSRSALALFQKLIDTYPKSSYAKSARARIKELTQNP